MSRSPKPRPEGRPSLSGKGDSPRLLVTLSPTLVGRLRVRASALGISRAELIRRALGAFLSPGAKAVGSESARKGARD